MAVVDASVWVSIHFASDRWHAGSIAWLRSALVAGEPLFTPTLALAEVAAAVRRRTGRVELALAAVGELLALETLEIVGVDQNRGRSAAEIAATAGLEGADAVYVALARERSEVLVTFDREQLERGAAVVGVRQP